VHFFKQRWVLADFESKTDWMNHSRTGVKSDVQLGRNVSRGFGYLDETGTVVGTQ
jgi:hypothetical protein